MVCEEKSQIDFQDGHCGGHLGVLIDIILAIFNLQVILLLQCEFQLKSPNGLGGLKLVFKVVAKVAILDS